MRPAPAPSGKTHSTPWLPDLLECAGKGQRRRRFRSIQHHSNLRSKGSTPLRFAGGIQIVILALLCGLFSAGCRKPAVSTRETTLSIDYEISPQPPRVGRATIALKISDSAGKPITGATVRVEGNMTHAGMTPLFGTAEETTPGSYRTPLNFSMGGDWVVLVHLTMSDGQMVERQFEIRGVRSE